MIAKGNRRGGGQNLAAHLYNAYNNDAVEIFEIRGFAARDLHGAFAEARAMASATRCKKYLYSLSVNPDNAKYTLTRDQYVDYITRAEKNLGLTGQPRAIVRHVKDGREHFHVVWSRIDPERIIAVLNSHDWRILKRVGREFARDHGLELPPGMRDDRDRKKRGAKLPEQQKAERTGIDPEQLRREISHAWDHSDNGAAFIASLAARGYTLARGERKGKPSYALVDRHGEIHSATRYIEAKAAVIYARLKSHPLDSLPSVDEARAAAIARLERQSGDDTKPKADTKQKHLTEIQSARRLALDLRHAEMKARHGRETTVLKDLHQAENKGVLAARLEKQPRGLTAFLTRITGIRAVVEFTHRRQDKVRDLRQKDQAGALERKHGREAEDMAAHYHDLARLEKREDSSMALQLRREKTRLLLGDPRTIQPDFTRAAQGRAAATGEAGGLSGPFQRAAEGPRLEKGDLQDAFQKAEATRAAPEKPKAATTDEERREQARQLAEQLRRATPVRDKDRDRER